MGGHSSTKQNATQTQNTTQSDTVTGIKPYQQQFNTQLGTVNKNLASTIGSIGKGPIFTQGLDPVVSGMMSQGISNIKDQSAANDAGLARGLSVAGTGDNSALLSVLQGQNAITNAGAMNSLMPQAMQQQREYDVARNNIQNQNAQTKLGAIGQQGNLLSAINGMANTSAGHTVRQRGTATQTGSSYTHKGFF